MNTVNVHSEIFEAEDKHGKPRNFSWMTARNSYSKQENEEFSHQEIWAKKWNET